MGSLENTRQTGGSLVVLAPRGVGGEGLSREFSNAVCECSEVIPDYGGKALDVLCQVVCCVTARTDRCCGGNDKCTHEKCTYIHIYIHTHTYICEKFSFPFSIVSMCPITSPFSSVQLTFHPVSSLINMLSP